MFRKLCLWSLFVLVVAAILSILFSDPGKVHVPKDHLGFKVLYVGENPTIDIVAIHGLDGHRENTWTSENGAMWLRDLLPKDIPNARILTYGFDADTRSFTQTSTLNIFRHAEAFITDLAWVRKETPERPILFLAHSLGGIILKKALARCHATSFNSPSQHRAIKVSTYAVLFFGTPHSGANGVELAQWLGRVSSVYMYTTRTILNDLGRDSAELESIQQAYLHASDDLKTIFLYEEYPTPIRGWFSEMIVPRHLATIQGERNAEVVVLHADHIQMVKFSDRSDGDYNRVAGYLADLVKDAPTKVEQNWVREGDHRIVDKGQFPIQNIVLPKPRPPVSRNYVERPHIQSMLTRNLLPSGTPKLQPRCVLHGLAGSGKTQLASFWIKMNKDRFDRIIYIDASSQYQIEVDLETALKSVNPRYSKTTWKDAVTYLYYAKRWLLFFDNADAPDLLLEDYLPDSPGGAVLITTRNRNLTHYAQECDVPVGKLSEREALDVLHAVANIRPPSEKSSIAIINELGRLAVAVTQAGAYIFEKPDFDMYLRIFRKNRDELMRNPSLKGRNYNWSTYAAFEMSFNQLPPKSRKFMIVCAFLHHSLIPRTLFENSIASQFRSHFSIPDYPAPNDYKTVVSDLEDIFGSEWDEFNFENLIDPVTQRSLMDTSTDDRRHSFCNIHPLVQTFIQDLQTGVEKGRYALIAGQLLLGAIWPTERGDNNWYRQLSPHVDSLPVDVKQAHVFNSLAFDEVYDSVGNWNASHPLREYTYFQFSDAFGPRYHKTIEAMRSLGLTLSNLGRFEEAEMMLRDALALWKDDLGLRHPDTISTMNDLAQTLYHRGQFEAAESMQREVLVLSKEVLGARHPDTIKAMNNLGTTLSDSGQYEAAESMQQEALVLSKEVLGLQHPYTIRAMRNLDLTLSNRGQLGAAEQMQREGLALRKDDLGLRHLDTMSAMNDLAQTLYHRGQFEAAESMQREILVLSKEVLGARHPDTIKAMNNLGTILSDLGQYEAAESMQQEALVLSRGVLGWGHSYTIRAMSKLVLTLSNRGYLQPAGGILRKVLTFQEEVLGLRHPDTIASINSLSRRLFRRGQPEEAE